MNEYLKSIDKQFEFNRGKNILFDANILNLSFSDEMKRLIVNQSESKIDSEDFLIDYVTEKALAEFCRINQYYSFNAQAKKSLRSIYRNLYQTIKSMTSPIEAVEKNHYHNLKQWLINTNPFTEKLYSRADTNLRPVACSEYTADMQIDILKIDTRTMIEPVLDIGCGRQGILVQYLCKLGIKAKGIDRFMFSDDRLVSSDWLEFDYGTVKWGTIVSHLGFSKHFTHHHLKEDGNFIGYTKKYMEILNSLKVGGTFHYSPNLPFVELYLNNKQYQIETHEIGKFDFRTTLIKRLK